MKGFERLGGEDRAGNDAVTTVTMEPADNEETTTHRTVNDIRGIIRLEIVIPPNVLVWPIP